MRLADALAGIPCVLLPLWFGGTALAVEPCRLDGDWVGERNGQFVEWRLESGRVRVDGRPADYQVFGDTLRVTFDSDLQQAAATPRETAVYRFMVSFPGTGPSRLFVYGFDLGNQGLLLELATDVEAPLPEDVSPPAPPAPPSSPSVRAATPPSARAKTPVAPQAPSGH